MRLWYEQRVPKIVSENLEKFTQRGCQKIWKFTLQFCSNAIFSSTYRGWGIDRFHWRYTDSFLSKGTRCKEPWDNPSCTLGKKALYVQRRYFLKYLPSQKLEISEVGIFYWIMKIICQNNEKIICQRAFSILDFLQIIRQSKQDEKASL